MNEELLNWATSTESKYLKARLSGLSRQQISKQFDITPQTYDAAMLRLRRRAAAHGWAPSNGLEFPTPDGFGVKKFTTWIDADGEQTRQCIQVERESTATAALSDEIIEALSSIKPTDAKPQPKRTASSLLSVYPLGDMHVGMYAHGEESGKDWDLKLAESRIGHAIDRLIDVAPPSKYALVANLGDLLHSDTSENRTPKSGNSLDVDTRWSKCVQVAVRLMARAIDRCLDKHARVRVINEIGNHDIHSSYMLSVALEQRYRDEKRCSIDMSPSRFHYYKHGNVFIGVHHGDTCKMSQLPSVMATDKPKDWGSARHRHWLTGHVHHKRLEEFPGCTVEAFRSPSPKDAWHSENGYRSDTDFQMIVYDCVAGETERHRIGI